MAPKTTTVVRDAFPGKAHSAIGLIDSVPPIDMLHVDILALENSSVLRSDDRKGNSRGFLAVFTTPFTCFGIARSFPTDCAMSNYLYAAGGT